MARRPRCPVCRSKRWHRDGLSGAIVCEEGHLLAGYVQETTETQEGPSQHTQTTRRIRKNRQRKVKPPAHDHFHGDRSQFLVWQAMQLILREQLRVLIDELGWPVELEAVSRDLWTLLVASSAEKSVPPAPRDYHLDEEPATSYSGPRKGARYNRAGRKPYGRRGVKKEDGDAPDDQEQAEADDEHDRDGPESDGEAHDGSATEGEVQSDADSDAESFFSDGDDQDADDERPRPGRSRRTSPAIGLGLPSSPGGPNDAPMPSQANQGKNRFPPHKRRRTVPPPSKSHDVRDHPRLEYTLLVIYLACITLKLPVILADLFCLADTYRILYLDAAIHLPAEMQAHLPKQARDILSPSTTPPLYTHNVSFDRLASDDAGTVQGTLARLVSLYREDWKVEFPEANVPLLLARICCGWLALPPSAYHLTLSLLSHLPTPPSFYLPASLHLSHAKSSTAFSSLVGGWPRARAGSQDWRVALPEVKLASLVVMVCRLLWDLERESSPHEADGMARSSSLATSLLDGRLPDKARWLEAVERLAQLDQPGDPTPLWRREVVDMSVDDIDAYLDFFERKIVSHEKVPSRMETVSRYFPPPLPEDVPPVEQLSPQDYLDRAEELVGALYSSATGTAGSTPGAPAEMRSILPETNARQHLPFSPSELPKPLIRLLTVLASRLTPLPSSLHVGLGGPAPTDATTGVANLLPFIDQVERALLAGVHQADAENDADSTAAKQEAVRALKNRAESERRERFRQERERRRAVDLLRRVAVVDPEEAEDKHANQAIDIRLEDLDGREIQMGRFRGRLVKSKEVVDSDEDEDVDMEGPERVLR